MKISRVLLILAISLTALVAVAPAATAAPSFCSEGLRYGDRFAKPHDGHYDSYAFIDAYNISKRPNDQERHLFHNRTHKTKLDKKCSDIYVNHPGTSPRNDRPSLCRKDNFTEAHNGHYDSWKLIAHYDSLHNGRHTHAWWNKTHDRYQRQSYCGSDY